MRYASGQAEPAKYFVISLLLAPLDPAGRRPIVAAGQPNMNMNFAPNEEEEEVEVLVGHVHAGRGQGAEVLLV